MNSVGLSEQTPNPTGRIAHEFANLVDTRDWQGLGELLAAEATVHFVHDDKKFTGAGWVEFNADYPGRWSFVAEDIVTNDDRAVIRARVFNEEEMFHVASFLTVADGLISEIVEVWTDGQTRAAAED